MVIIYVKLILNLLIILISCELFTNSIEWIGKRFRMGDGATGSILSAVGTCLPETIIPVIAIIFSDKSKSSIEVGIGAIAGAPFMLGTLAFFVTGISVLVFARRRKNHLAVKVNAAIVTRDLEYFILAYSLGIAVSFVQADWIRTTSALFLVILYFFYVYNTISNDKTHHNEVEPLYISNMFKIPARIRIIFLQLLLAFTGIILGAHFFVLNLEEISDFFGVSVLVLSLLITPVATELPEKFNSVLWIRRGKDTLAIGNITGAMVFQSCIPVAIGMMYTGWKLNEVTVISGMLALASAGLVLFQLWGKKRVSPFILLIGGAIYLIFLMYVRQYGLLEM